MVRVYPMNGSSASRVVEFHWLGKRVRIETDDRDLAGYLGRQWGSIPGDPGPSGPQEDLRFRVTRDASGTPVLESDRGRAPLDPTLPVLHAYNRIVLEILGTIDRQFVFHASAVAGPAGAALISGPSTFGKSTLAVHLALSGFRWLADDVGILDRATGCLQPFDRPLRLRPGARATLPARHLEAAREARIDDEGDDWIVRPGRWFEVQDRATQVRTVTILRPVADGAALRRFPFHAVRLRAGREGLADELASLPGIVGASISATDPSRSDLEVRDPSALETWLARHGDEVVYAVKFAAGAAAFDGTPRLTPISRFQAALELCQEMQNRHRHSRLDREYDGRAAELVADVAVALGAARCFALTPGRLEETIELVRTAYEDGV